MGIIRAVAGDVTSAVFNQNVWQKEWHLYRKGCVFNYSAAVETRTAKPLRYDDCLLVCTNILEEREGSQFAFCLHDERHSSRPHIFETYLSES